MNDPVIESPDNNSVSATPSAKRAQRAFLFSVLLAGTMATLLVILFFVWGSRLDEYVTIASIINILVAVGGALLVRRGFPDRGIMLALLAFAINLFVLVIRAEGAGLLIAFTFTVAGMGIVSRAFSPRYVGRSAPLVAIMGLAMLLADFYWPFDRPGVNVEDLVIGYLIAPALLILILVDLWRNFNTYTLRAKLIIALIGATIVPLVIISATITWQTRNALISDANQALLANASQVGEAVDALLLNIVSNVRTEASFSIFVDYLSLPEAERSGSQEELLARRLLLQLSRRDVNYISSYALLDRNGFNLLDTAFRDEGESESTQTYFQTPFATGQPYISSFLYDDEFGLSLYFSAPIRDVGGQVVGVVRVRYNVGVLQQLINENVGRLGLGSGPILLDENFIRLADGLEPSTVLKSVVPLDEAVLTRLQGFGRIPDRAAAELATNLPAFAAGLANADAEPVFTAEVHSLEDSQDTVAVVRLETKPWYLAFSQPEEVYLEPIQAQIETTVLLAFVMSLLVGVGAVILANVLVAPIGRLTTVAEEIAAGNFAAQATADADDEIGRLASSFNTMTSRLRDLIDSLEQRVAERTRALETSTEVGRRLSNILDRDELVREVVTQIQSAFNYYHAHIYLFDDKKENLLMTGGTGEAGRILLERAHRIPRGKGLVGRAAQTNAVVLVSDVTQDKTWLPNPLLPETKSEVAVPIALGEDVLGVLDVQHNIINGLQQQDADLLLSIANQVANTLRNARNYELSQEQAARQALINEINQQILGATDMDEAMQIAIREIGRAVGATETEIQLEVTQAKNGRSA